MAQAGGVETSSPSTGHGCLTSLAFLASTAAAVPLLRPRAGFAGVSAVRLPLLNRTTPKQFKTRETVIHT